MQLACNTKIHCFLSLFATRVTTHWLKQLFIAMLASVHPHLEFSVLVWAPGLTKRKTKRAARWIFVQWDKSTTHLKYRHPYNTCRYTINNHAEPSYAQQEKLKQASCYPNTVRTSTFACNTCTCSPASPIPNPNPLLEILTMSLFQVVESAIKTFCKPNTK